MTNFNKNESWLTKDLNAFYKWLEDKYPEIYEKYYDNFSIPFQQGGGFTVNNNNKISQEEFDKITAIANEFYTTPDA